jgi:hypothetical protein
MSKKNFTGGLNSLLGETKPQSKKIDDNVTIKKEVKELKLKDNDNETRATFIIKEDVLNKLKSIAYWERIKIKEALNNALEEYIDKYEKKNGQIKL